MRNTLLTALLAAFLISIPASAQPKVPSSISFGGQTITFDRPDLYERMDRELISFCYMHTTTTLMLKRSERLFHVVLPIMKEYGIPEDLKYLMCIESNLDPQAVSPAGAAGLWQFMASSAKEFGLEVNTNVDERYNIEKETEAACKYLKRLYSRYGDWMTVAACYNAGPAGIATRLSDQHQKSAMNLWLVPETSRYMFRILACKMLFENPSAFGFNITLADCYRYEAPKEVVTVSAPIPDLVKFAEEHGVSYLELRLANLWLRESKLNNTTKKVYKIVIPR